MTFRVSVTSIRSFPSKKINNSDSRHNTKQLEGPLPNPGCLVCGTAPVGEGIGGAESGLDSFKVRFEFKDPTLWGCLTSLSHMPDETFHWYCDEGSVEDIARYRLGGYHPVKLGDCFSTFPAKSTNQSCTTLPRYRVLHKLGHGSFATVWLARDMSPSGCVPTSLWSQRSYNPPRCWVVGASSLSRSRSQICWTAAARPVSSNSSLRIAPPM